MRVKLFSWIAPFIGAALSSAILARFIASENQEILNLILKWILESKLFFALFYIVYFLTGFLIFHAGQRGAWIFEAAPKIINILKKAYPPVAGNISGWVLVVCYEAISSNSDKYIYTGSFLIFLVFYLALTPIITLEIANYATEKYNSNFIRERKNKSLFKLSGLMLLTGVLVGVIHDLFF